MEKLDSKSLMLGDWVRNDLGEIQMIEEIRQEDVMLSYNDYYSYDEIEPIPLTPEILEKNKFRLIGKRFVFGEIDDDIVELNLSINNSYRAKISVADLMTSHNGWIKYIHELQHALRLCGIDKTIEP